ncbi:MAG: hypothetical protein HQ582_06795 [Planctomycetes bacterium]|nr:hypothetical protein [Planctomycetota bacterium]
MNERYGGPASRFSKRLCLFLLVLPAFEAPELTEQDVADFRTHFTAYTKMVREKGADLFKPDVGVGVGTMAMNQWGPFTWIALQQPDMLLPMLLDEIPRSSDLSVAFLWTESSSAGMEKVTRVVHDVFTQVVCNHAEDIGVKAKASATRAEDFIEFCRQKWPMTGIDPILRVIAKGNIALDKQEDLAFAVAWSTEQMRRTYSSIVYGDHSLQGYLTAFPNGKHAELARAWIEAK